MKTLTLILIIISLNCFGQNILNDSTKSVGLMPKGYEPTFKLHVSLSDSAMDEDIITNPLAAIDTLWINDSTITISVSRVGIGNGGHPPEIHVYGMNLDNTSPKYRLVLKTGQVRMDYYPCPTENLQFEDTNIGIGDPKGSCGTTPLHIVGEILNDAESHTDSVVEFKKFTTGISMILSDLKGSNKELFTLCLPNELRNSNIKLSDDRYWSMKWNSKAVGLNRDKGIESMYTYYGITGGETIKNVDFKGVNFLVLTDSYKIIYFNINKVEWRIANGKKKVKFMKRFN